MGIKEFFHFGRARDKPTDFYNGTDYRFLFGPTTSGKNVNEFSITCIRVCAENALIYQFKDGSKVTMQWKDRSRSLGWTVEMKAAARQKALERKKN